MLLHSRHKNIRVKRAAEIGLGDFHTGHIYGMFYPSAAFDHKTNEIQRYSLRVMDNHFLPDVEAVLDQWKPDYVHVIFTGDMGDLDYKNRSPEEYWVRDSGIISDNLKELLDPLAKMSDHMRFVIGTKSHGGASGGVDAAIARDFDNTIWLKKGHAASREWNYKLAGVSIEARHKGVNPSAAAKANLLNTLSKKILMDKVEYGKTIPQVAWRGHNHWIGRSDEFMPPVVYQCPSWQLGADYLYEMSSDGRTTEVGGWVNIYEDGKTIYSKRLRYWRKDA